MFLKASAWNPQPTAMRDGFCDFHLIVFPLSWHCTTFRALLAVMRPAAGKFKRQIAVIVIKMHEIPLISNDAFRACPLHLFTNQPANLEGLRIRETRYICLSLCVCVCVFSPFSQEPPIWKQRFPLSELQC